MTEKKQRTAALAAASVLGLSLGMVALNADAEQHKNPTSTQIKGVSNQDKHNPAANVAINPQPEPPGANQIKLNSAATKNATGIHKTGTGSNQLKWDGVSKQGKFKPGEKVGLNPQPEPPASGPISVQDKHVTGIHKTGTGSNQIKWEGVSNQHKGQLPSSELNPQPEPPKPTGTAKPK
jgi:hypothetical protein